MDTIDNYNRAVEALKAEMIETAAEMGLDVEYYKDVVLANNEFATYMSADIAEKMLATA